MPITFTLGLNLIHTREQTQNTKYYNLHIIEKSRRRMVLHIKKDIDSYDMIMGVLTRILWFYLTTTNSHHIDSLIYTV